MRTLAPFLILSGAFLVLMGLAFAGRLGRLGRLPGDIVVDRPGFTFAAPIMTSIVLSIVLSVALTLALRFFGR